MITAKLRRVGQGMVISVPSAIVKLSQHKEGQRFEVKLRGKNISLVPVKSENK